MTTIKPPMALDVALVWGRNPMIPIGERQGVPMRKIPSRYMVRRRMWPSATQELKTRAFCVNTTVHGTPTVGLFEIFSHHNADN